MAHWNLVLLEEVYRHSRQTLFHQIPHTVLGAYWKKTSSAHSRTPAHICCLQRVNSPWLSFDVTFKYPGNNLPVRHNGVHSNHSLPQDILALLCGAGYQQQLSLRWQCAFAQILYFFLFLIEDWKTRISTFSHLHVSWVPMVPIMEILSVQSAWPWH